MLVSSKQTKNQKTNLLLESYVYLDKKKIENYLMGYKERNVQRRDKGKDIFAKECNIRIRKY